MTLQQLRYILELSKHNSISAAAQALNIAQPSLSAAIKDLETEFAMTLVKRNRHGITFTSAGLEFLHYADHILTHADEMHDHFHPETGQEDSHTLTISSQHYPFADEVSSMPCSAYLRRHPIPLPCVKVGPRRSSTTSSPVKSARHPLFIPHERKLFAGPVPKEQAGVHVSLYVYALYLRPLGPPSGRESKYPSRQT